MWGKVLTGVAVGVGAVAAAPFTGGGSVVGGATLLSSLAGAGTVAVATGAGLTGAAVGAAMADHEEKKEQDRRKQSKAEGKAEGKAESLAKIKKLKQKLIEAIERLQAHDAHFKVIIALEAVGVACAACDDDFSDNEKKEIGEFVTGMVGQSIPEDVKAKIQSIYDNPPTVKEAYQLAEASGIELEFYEVLIQLVMQIDGIKKEEQVFVQAWNQLKAA